MKKLRIGVIGAGRIGRVHAPNLVRRVANAQVVALADIDRSAARELGEPLGIPAILTDYREILSDASVDAVFLCSPTDTHVQMAVEAAKAGKHIFCEKPIDQRVEGIREVISAVEAAGVKCQVGFNRRFDRNFWRIYEAVGKGEVGAVQVVKISSRDPVAPSVSYAQTSGGIFADMMIHDFDMVEHLANSRVAEVCASGACLIDPKLGEVGDVDTSVVMLRLESGALAVIDNSRQAVYGYDQRIEVFGSKGMISADNETADNTTLSTADGVYRAKPLWFFLERYTQAFVQEEQGFVDACLTGGRVLISARDSLSPAAIAIAAGKSLAAGGAPVRVER
jgi:myo-inositol 2-dehydrogenase/D-chiro-inositol 1-dehydrogenase